MKPGFHQVPLGPQLHQFGLRLCRTPAGVSPARPPDRRGPIPARRPAPRTPVGGRARLEPRPRRPPLPPRRPPPSPPPGSPGPAPPGRQRRFPPRPAGSPADGGAARSARLPIGLLGRRLQVFQDRRSMAAKHGRRPIADPRPWRFTPRLPSARGAFRLSCRRAIRGVPGRPSQKVAGPLAPRRSPGSAVWGPWPSTARRSGQPFPARPAPPCEAETALRRRAGRSWPWACRPVNGSRPASIW